MTVHTANLLFNATHHLLITKEFPKMMVLVIDNCLQSTNNLTNDVIKHKKSRCECVQTM